MKIEQNVKQQTVKRRLDQNQQIVQLLKLKLTPLSKKGNQSVYLPPVINSKPHKMPEQKRHKMPSIHDQELNLEQQSRQSIDIHPVLEKAKQYLKQSKKHLSLTPTYEEKKQLLTVDMSKYLHLFQKKSSKESSEMAKMKKEVDVEETLAKRVFTETKQSIRMSDLQASLLNARIRQILNHKKIISLGK